MKGTEKKTIFLSSLVENVSDFITLFMFGMSQVISLLISSFQRQTADIYVNVFPLFLSICEDWLEKVEENFVGLVMKVLWKFLL